MCSPGPSSRRRRSRSTIARSDRILKNKIVPGSDPGHRRFVMEHKELLELLENGLQSLADASPDGVSKRNDVGFSGSTLGHGRRLLSILGEWSFRDLAKAWQICRTHNGQLGGNIPPITESALAALAEQHKVWEVEQVEAAETCAEYGLDWSAGKLVNTSQGERFLRKAAPTPAFWLAWRTQKDTIKAAGYSVAQKDGVWQVCHWGVVNDDRRPAPQLDPVFTVRPLPADIAAKLKPYQIEPAATLVAHLKFNHASGDLSDLGVGKSYESLAAALAYGAKRILVVAPIATAYGWDQVAAHFELAARGCELIFCGWEALRGSSRKVKQADGEKVTVFRDGRPDLLTFHQGFGRYSWTDKVDVILFDEIHRAKAPNTLNSKLVRAAVRQNIPVLGLTGTLAKDPLELRAFGYLLGLHEDRNFYSWVTQYGVEKGRFGFQFNTEVKEIASAHLLALHTEIEKRTIRIRKTDPAVAHHFPENQVIVKGFSGAVEEITAARDQMNAELAELDEAARNDKRPGLAVTIRLRAKQRIDLIKVPFTIDFVRDLLEEGYSVVVGVNYDSSLDALIEGLSEFEPIVIRGGQTGEDRKPMMHLFQTNQRRLMLMNKTAGGTGIGAHDTDGRFPRVTVGFAADSALTELQFQGRIPRSGGKSKCVQYIVGLWDDKTDRAVLENMAKKKGQLEQLIDGCISDDDLSVA